MAERKQSLKITPAPTDSPWGEPETIEDLSQGLYFVHAGGHGGLHIGTPIIKNVPKAVLKCLLDGPTWAEEDCEAPIILNILTPHLDKEALLKITQSGQTANDRAIAEYRLAKLATERHERYSPCRKFLREPALQPMLA